MYKVILLLVLIKCLYSEGSDPTVITKKGTIKGLQAKDGYFMFLGVPYALVDESNPFGAALPHPGFNETYEAFDDSVACPQTSRSGALLGTMQCLQLNIYVPNNANFSNKIPVMVYIHGGSFIRGSKMMVNLSPKFLIRNDVIIVSINYRLGPYGFLCVSAPGYSNQGLKDQILALKWVKDNIEAFGGDTTKITAFGQSAGAMTLDLQLLTNKDLVQRVIIQSGTALTTWVIGKRNDSIPVNLASKLGYSGDDVHEALNYLADKEPMDIIQAGVDTGISNAHPLTKPCVETVGDNAYLTDFPVNLQPQVEGMDIMIGHTNKEVMFIYPKDNKEYYENYRFAEELEQGFNVVFDEDNVRHFYTGDQVLSLESQNDIFDFGTDFVFAYPTERSVNRYLKANANKVYRYLFAYEGGRNKNKLLGNFTAPGACHGDDIGYLFEMDTFKGEVPNKDDQKMIDVMTTMWTNFAKDPTPSSTDLITTRWEPTEPGSTRRPYLVLDQPITLKYRIFHQRLSFWELYYKLYKNDERGFEKK
ncbi:bile salt-activated lipase-like isoform X2 [Spodoptera litura]|uniref:Bile salt-activated lipase-like isoform X2 n=1 Tax=Spodoptera litura TaxID=69820 RepID=A0A9J7EI75_SPOLT|nr:bile salt-activated lipase-like isoform X2 [Spodoptera litura]